MDRELRRAVADVGAERSEGAELLRELGLSPDTELSHGSGEVDDIRGVRYGEGEDGGRHKRVPQAFANALLSGPKAVSLTGSYSASTPVGPR